MHGHVIPAPSTRAATVGTGGARHPRWMLRLATSSALGLVAVVGTGVGIATAWDSPATAVVSCAPDRLHWQATITITDNGPSAYTLSSSSLDVMRWSSTAALSGMSPGSIVAPGTTITAEVTGLPLGTAGAVVTYSGAYADGRVETNNLTLSRPVPSCDEPGAVTATTGAAESTTGVETTTTEPAITATTYAVVGGVISASSVTTDSGGVLGESVTTAPSLAATGGGLNLVLAVTALGLVVVGTLFASVHIRRADRREA